MITMKEESAPSTPSSGYVRAYAKTDGLLYFKDDAGTEHPMFGRPTMPGAMVTTTGGTEIGFTGIRSGTRAVTMLLNAVSWSGSHDPIFQIGDSGGYENSGYTGVYNLGAGGGNATSGTSGVGFATGWSGSHTYTGKLVLTLIDPATFLWEWDLRLHETTVPFLVSGVGKKALTAELDRVRFTTAAGTATVDANAGCNVLYM